MKIKAISGIQLMFSFIFLLTFIAFRSDNDIRDFTPGLATFTVRTVSASGSYAPKHVLAIWIEDSAGNFIKTMKLRGNLRKQYLYTWNAKSAGNVVDAITGATLTAHTTHTVSWNCRDLSGNIVPDGSYSFFVEFTEAHAQGPLTSVSFIKGANPVYFTKPDETNFKDIALTYGSTISIDEPETITNAISIYPNPFREMLAIQINNKISGPVEINIFNIYGALVNQFKYMLMEDTHQFFHISLMREDLHAMAEGTYIIEIINGSIKYSRKIVSAK